MITIKYNGKLPRANQRYYKNFALTKEYRSTKEAIAWAGKKEMIGKEIYTEPLWCAISLKVGYRGDIDSCIKGLLDSLQGVVYKNDLQIQRLIVSKNEDIDCDVKISIAKYEM